MVNSKHMRAPQTGYQKPTLEYATPIKRTRHSWYVDILVVLFYAIGMAAVVLFFFGWLFYMYTRSIS